MPCSVCGRRIRPRDKLKRGVGDILPPGVSRYFFATGPGEWYVRNMGSGGQRHLMEAIDKIRKMKADALAEAECKELKGAKYIWLKNPWNLTEN
ncbi:MAG: transposase [Thermodesulfobacteriota bacterium]